MFVCFTNRLAYFILQKLLLLLYAKRPATVQLIWLCIGYDYTACMDYMDLDVRFTQKGC